MRIFLLLLAVAFTVTPMLTWIVLFRSPKKQYVRLEPCELTIADLDLTDDLYIQQQ